MNKYYKFNQGLPYSYNQNAIKNSDLSNIHFISFIIHNILQKPLTDPIISEFKDFSTHILPELDEEDILIFHQCEQIIQSIITCILNDDTLEKEHLVIFNTYQESIIPIHHFIVRKKYKEAIQKYQLMTQLLVDYYNLNEEYNQIKGTSPEENKDENPKRRAKSIEINQNL